MGYKCPVEGCESSDKDFQTEAALKSHIRNKHPDYLEELEAARQVPIVEEDFATLLRKFKIKADLAYNIAENVSHTGGPMVFEDPELLLKRLSSWSSDIPPAKRKNIIEQWFAERGVDIPLEIRQLSGMTAEQIHLKEKETKEKESEVRYIYDTEVNKVRMAREGEKGGTLAQAKELKKMAEEDEDGGKESPFMMDGEGNFVLNPKARVGGVELLAYNALKQAAAKGETLDPLTAMTEAADRIKIMKESFGGGGSSNLPAWMTDPVAFTEAITKITGGGKGEDSAVKETMLAMQHTIEELKEDRWRAQFDSQQKQTEVQQKQIQDLAGTMNKMIEAITDMKKGMVGRSEMDILHEVATEGISLAKSELPGLRKDIKEALSSMPLPSNKSPEQREDRRKKYREAIDTDRDIEDIGRRIFFA